MKTLPRAWGLVEVFGSMSETETKPMASTVADSLFQSFRQVPPVAVPAMMDCVLTSSGLAPSSLLLSLMDAFPTLHEDVASEHGKLDFDKCDYLSSYVGAVCHLLKKPGESHNYMQLFIYKCYIPLMKMVPGFDGEMLSRIGESFFGVLIETNNWAVIEATLVPLFLRSVGLSMGMLQNDELTIYRWSSFTVFKSSNETNNISESDGQYPNGNFPLPVSCHILTLILNAALQSCEGAKGSSKFVLTNGCSYAEKVAANMLWDLCNTSIQMLLQSMEHRSCALGSLLPCIFRAFVVRGSFEIMINEQRLLLSRKQLLKKLWICCKTLFSMASSERGDAYSVLSLYLSFFSCIVGSGDTDVSDGAEDFDIRTEKEFWNEIKRGLVDEEGIVRKQCLHILKTALQINETSNCCTDSTLHGKESIQNGMTRRELWADEEAKSLGVGKICNHLDNCLNGQQRWEAFLLLYEMLEEYGIHLVEAAWTHQITMLLHNTAIHDDFLKVTRSEAYQNQMESLEGIYDWLGILWERGFCHDNPQVRCLVMQSFLGFKWKNLESYAKLVPESFVLGPLILALNDPVQHKDFGVRGVYSSRTIEGAIEFYCQYTSLLSVRSGITFLKNLASVAKQHSFGRAGLMGLVKCIGSAARGVQARDEIEPNLCKDNLPGMIDENKTELLDVLRFLMESSKQHFNPKYRLQVCENVLEAAASLVCTFDVPLEALLHFISAVPREFIDYIGSLRVKVQEWLLEYGKNHNSENSCTRMRLLASIYDFPARFINHLYPVGSFYTYDDEDLDSWESESRRWARLLFLVIEEEHDLEPLLMFIQNHGTSIGQGNKHLKWEPLKLLILILSLVQEIQLMNERTSGSHIKVEPKTEFVLLESVDQSCRIKDCILTNKFTMCFLSILEDVVSFANLSCSIFWSKVVTEDTILPSSVTGKLGGPSQRRLSSSLTTAVLKAVCFLPIRLF